jgi:hypothetical protein
MPSVRICRLLGHPGERVWHRISDYNTWFEWLSRVTDSRMENDTATPAAVGAVRRVGDWDAPRVREELLAHDQTTWTVRYGVAAWPEWRFPARNYVATARVIPLTEQAGAVVDWSGRFDCDQADEEQLIKLFQGLYQSFLDDLDADLRAARGTIRRHP